MGLDTLLFWLLILTFCELSLATSTAAMLGAGGVAILTSCAWLVRLDLDLLAFLLAATYSSVLVCLTLVQTNLEGYPGLASIPTARASFYVSDALVLLLFGCTFVGTQSELTFIAFFADFYQSEGDWFEQVIGVFHLFFYRTATFEAILLNLFLLITLIASLSILHSLNASAGSTESLPLRGVSRIRLVRAFRRQVRRKNSSQIRSAKR